MICSTVCEFLEKDCHLTGDSTLKNRRKHIQVSSQKGRSENDIICCEKYKVTAVTGLIIQVRKHRKKLRRQFHNLSREDASKFPWRSS